MRGSSNVIYLPSTHCLLSFVPHLHTKIEIFKPDLVAYLCNPTTQEAEAGKTAEFEASLSCTVRPCLKKRKKEKDLHPNKNKTKQNKNF
jgi:hypothetical protein